MKGFRLSRFALLALLPGSSVSATETTPDDEAALVTMEEVLTTSPPPNGGAASSGGDESDSSIWGTGKFILQRSQVVVPSDEARGYWYCSGGKDGVNNRMMLFEPNITFDDIAIDTSAWQDPNVDDWNATLNAYALDGVDLISFSVGGGSGCGCDWFQLNFWEWLRSNSEAGSSIATDLYQTPNFPLINWYFPPQYQYLPNNNNAWVIQTVYTGEALSSVSSGWQPPAILGGVETTTNRYLRIRNTGGPVTLRAMSNSPRAYGIVAYLFKENPDPSDKQDTRPINSMDLYVDEVSDVTEATAMKFASAPLGYYYSLFIRNDFEDDRTQWSSEPPYECTMGPNGLSTQYDITYSLQTCAEAACNAGTIVVDYFPPDTSAGKAVVGSVSVLMTIAALFAALSTA